MKMKAAVIREMGLEQPYAKSRPLQIEEVELAPPGEREVLVQIKAASLCHSDLSTVNADRPRQMPMVLGHEAAGVIIECGPGITDVKPGDHVALGGPTIPSDQHTTGIPQRNDRGAVRQCIALRHSGCGPGSGERAGRQQFRRLPTEELREG